MMFLYYHNNKDLMQGVIQGAKMQNINKLAKKTKNATLYLMIPMMMVACKSREQKISDLNTEIERIESEITRTNRARDTAISDSARNNIMYMFLLKWIDQDEEHIDSLRTRNRDLTDSIQTKRVKRAATQYPLSALLSKQEIYQIITQLKEFHNEWNAVYAKNIIAGRGTLLDLYKVCFDLDYNLFEPSFFIINDEGDIRFDDWRDKICIEFEAERSRLEQEEILNTMRKYTNQQEFIQNERIINEFDRKCNACDSIYTEIENHFKTKFKTHLDSLNATKNNLMHHKDMLIRETIMKRK